MKSFQKRAVLWVQTAFGALHASNVHERAHRFLEEAIELFQAAHMTREAAHAMVDYVFDREPGTANQEIGGVMLTVVTLADAMYLDAVAEGERELARVNTPETIKRCRIKHETKPR